MVLSLAGVAVISLGGGGNGGMNLNVTGLLLAALSAVLWASYWMVNNLRSNRADASVGLFATFLFGAVYLTVGALCVGVDLNTVPGVLSGMYVGAFEMGIPFRSNTDSEVAAKLIGYFTQRAGRLRSGIAHTMRMLEGGYAMVLVRENALYAFRDPHGIRPLVLGRLGDDGWVVASETCALDIAGATFVREVSIPEWITSCAPRASSSAASASLTRIRYSRSSSTSSVSPWWTNWCSVKRTSRM